jgi:hypothetical protein
MEALEDAGVDLDAVVPYRKSEEDPVLYTRPKYNFITWGQHKATSKYAYCKHVFAVGILRREQLEVSSAIAAQKEDLHDPMVNDHHQIARVLCSEMFYCLQQLVGRGPARESVMGHAKESHIRVYTPQLFPEDLIEKGLPRVEWRIVEPDVAAKKPREGTLTAELAEKIEAYLREQPVGVCKVSCRALKADLGIETTPDTFKAARDVALDAAGWRLEGRSIART